VVLTNPLSSHENKEHDMSKDPFDQEAFNEAPDTLPRTSDGRTDVAKVVAERRREASLHLHINRTVERCLAVLAKGSSFATNQEALEIIVKAAPKYARLGGPPAYWKDGISKAGHRAGPK
jgi:hypothetical protein